MTDETGLPQWEETIYQLDITDSVLGGPEGPSNRPLIQLAGRTQWLREKLTSHEEADNPHPQYADALSEAMESHLDGADPHPQYSAQITGFAEGHVAKAHPHPQYHGAYRATASGTPDAMIAAFDAAMPEPPADQTLVFIRALDANTGPATLTVAGHEPREIVNGNGKALRKGEISGPGYDMFLQYSALTDKWVLINPVPIDSSPVGAMMYWPLPEPPEGWLERNGAALSRTAFAGLFAMIGTMYGEGDGETTFNLPDDRGLFERGWDNTRGYDAEREFGDEQGDAIRNITDSIGRTAVRSNAESLNGLIKFSSATSGYGGTNSYVAIGTLTFDASNVVPTAEENRPRNRAYLPIIKYR